MIPNLENNVVLVCFEMNETLYKCIQDIGSVISAKIHACC